MPIRASLVSGNRHKARELAVLLPGWEIEPTAAEELPEEVGSSFYANARAKARFGRTVEAPDRWTMGRTRARGGRARRPAGDLLRPLRGPEATDEENVAKLLAELGAVTGAGRRARYVCELVALSPGLEEVRGRGTLEGSIAVEPRGSGGFGYDPVFVPDGEQRTVAELGDSWKAGHSHRAAAARQLLEAVAAALRGCRFRTCSSSRTTTRRPRSVAHRSSRTSRAELVALAKVTEDLEVEEGKVLAREEIGQEFFVIVDGEVSVSKGGQEIRRLSSGDFFGEIALIWDSPRRTATVTAATPLRFFVLTRQSFRSLIATSPTSRKVLEALEERVNATEAGGSSEARPTPPALSHQLTSAPSTRMLAITYSQTSRSTSPP